MLVGGCEITGAFACSDDEQCRSGAVDGACQANGYCSFPDESCATGHRFGDAAPDGVANTCVEPVEDTGTTTTTTGSDDDPLPPGTTGPADDGMPPPMTTNPAVDSSTSVSYDGTTTDFDPDTGIVSEGSTTDEGPECSEVVVDDFDGELLSGMWTTLLPMMGAAIGVADGQLQISIDPSPETVAAAVTTNIGPVAGGSVRVLISEFDAENPLNAGFSLSNGVCELRIYIDDGGFVLASATQDDMTTPLGEGPMIMGPPLWLQLSQDDDGEIDFEWSSDGMWWEKIARTYCEDMTGELELNIGAWGQLALPGLQTFDRVEACLP
jgi:hypothetical protein